MRPHKVCQVAYAGSDVAGPDACQERGGSVPERAGPVKLQTKGDNGFLLCSDWHSSPGEQSRETVIPFVCSFTGPARSGMLPARSCMLPPRSWHASGTATSDPA